MEALRECPFVLAASGTILLIAGLGSMVLRNASAALRARLLSTSIVLVCLMPIITPMFPAPRAPGVPAHVTEAATLSGGAQDEGFGRVHASEAQGSADGEAGPAHEWPALVVGLWLLGVALGLTRLIDQHRRIHRIAGAAQPVREPELSAAHSRLCSDLGIRLRVRLRQHPAIAGPLTVGVLRPRILLPRGATAWSTETAEAILRHELAHVKRGDNLINLLGAWMVAWQWFNPLAWWVLHRYRREAELACDDAVLLGGLRPSAYARALMAYAQLAPRNRLFHVAPAFPFATHAGRRVRALLDPRTARRPPARPVTWLTAAALLMTAMPATSLRPTVQAGANDPPSGQVSGPSMGEVLSALAEPIAEIRESRAIRSWFEDPSRGTPLREGRWEDPDGRWIAEAHHAVALEGAKYGCIFTSLDGYFSVTRIDGSSMRVLSVHAVRHPEPGPFQRWVDRLASCAGLSPGGDFRAYSLECFVDGQRLSYGTELWHEFQETAAMVAAQQRDAEPESGMED